MCKLVRSRNFQKKQCMYLTDMFLKTPLLILIILISAQKGFPKFELPNLGCGLSVSADYTPVFTVSQFVSGDQINCQSWRLICKTSTHVSDIIIHQISSLSRNWSRNWGISENILQFSKLRMLPKRFEG